MGKAMCRHRCILLGISDPDVDVVDPVFAVDDRLDINSKSPETTGVLMNREVLAINQDSLCQQAARIKKTGDLEIWRKRL